ncbi:iron chelate uptake ABC transporter family permease subunit [Bacillus lacus]|uniref:Iron chelate uptake ABC transporter family permease subunit n=1 Tax=Metabacillus lacus TaxID=1983721 RepID=A0A7X2J0W5_9BACI|nr:iron ABC transporter permease [Metabacillus lacus]MRX73239.1 iron chelate uptake ABC transporter family permease subunit [Metabacillus lacus]
MVVLSHIKRKGSLFIWASSSLAAVFLCFALSISLGAVPVPLQVIAEAFYSFNPQLMEHQLIKEVRLPRALSAALTGAALAVTGTIMQGMTRNPLADPSIIGITQGAGLAIAIYLAFFSSGSYWILLAWSFLGSAAAASAIMAFTVLSKDQLSPVSLTLAGAALGTLFSALSTGIALYFQVSQDISFWFAGGLSGVKWQHVYILFPVTMLGLGLSLIISRSLTILSLGDEIAAGLGESKKNTRIIGLIAVILLSGAAVAIAGAIGFIGLVVPHIVRSIVGADYRILLPFSAVAGAFLLLLADIGARMINPPFETPVSAITALIGVPFFLWLSRRGGRSL